MISFKPETHCFCRSNTILTNITKLIYLFVSILMLAINALFKISNLRIDYCAFILSKTFINLTSRHD